MKPMNFSVVYPTSSQANSSGVAWVSPMMSARPSDSTVPAIASVSVASTMPATSRVAAVAAWRRGRVSAALLIAAPPIALSGPPMKPESA